MSTAPPVRTRAYDFHGIALNVTADLDAVGRAIDDRLRPFATTARSEPELRFELRAHPPDGWTAVPATGGRPVYESPAGRVRYFDAEDAFCIDVGDETLVLARPADGVVRTATGATRPDLWLHSRPLFTLPFIELLKRRGLYSVHAGCVASGDRAILLPGASGSGKSTLAVALARAGFGFMSDDMVFADATGTRLYSFPDEVDLTDETLSFFPELRAAAGARPAGWPKHRLRLEAAIGAVHVASAVPHLALFPWVRDGDDVDLVEIRPGDALVEAVPNVLLTDSASSQAHLDALAALLARCRCYRLGVTRDFERVERVVGSLLTQR